MKLSNLLGLESVLGAAKLTQASHMQHKFNFYVSIGLLWRKIHKPWRIKFWELLCYQV
jgi:hypothetical protein